MRTVAIALFTLAGCIDEFSGSEIQIDFSRDTPVQTTAFAAPLPDELPANIHFTLYAFQDGVTSSGEPVGRLFALQRFEIHRVVDLDSPCYIDVGEHVPFEGLHVSQYLAETMKLHGFTDASTPPADATEAQKVEVATALTRQVKVNAMAGHDGPKAITSASVGSGYEAVAASCSDTNGIPPPDCVDPDSNRRRLERCQAAWKADPMFFEGSDRVLTLPLAGTTHGFVIGDNPAGMLPIGGSAFFIDEVLEDFDGYAIYWQYDDADGNGMPDYPASVPASERNPLGTLFLFGRPESPTRGVIRAHLTSIQSPDISAHLAIFANIGEDDVHF